MRTGLTAGIPTLSMGSPGTAATEPLLRLLLLPASGVADGVPRALSVGNGREPLAV